MAKKSEFANLFDMASERQKKQAQEKAAPAPTPPEKVPLIGDVNEAVAKYKKMHDDLQKAIEQAFEKAKISPKQLEEYMADSSHFSDEAWRTICKTKNELDDKLDHLVKKREALQKQGAKIKKKKKGFASRKEWLQMG